ncbi:MAG: peptidylprolyl isomerase [Planctomycetota bacterium]
MQIAPALTTLSLILFTGCAGPAPRAGSLAPMDFTAAAAPAQEPDPLAQLRDDTPEPVSPPVAVQPQPEADLVPRVAVLPGEPETTPDAAVLGSGVLVDAKVGDISGRPIVAGEFLGALEGRLIAESARRPRDQWRRFAEQQIRTQLELALQDELLEAEARASLSAEFRQQGLLAAVRNLRQALVRNSLGSSILADQRVRQETGQTLDEVAEDQLSRELIRMAFNQNVRGRVHISRREMELFYERNFDTFNPKPFAVLQRIRVGTRFPEDEQAVQARLDAGEPFAAVAALPVNTNEGSLELPFPDFDSELSDLKPFRDDALNEAIGSLQPGETAGPIRTGRSIWWLHLERVVRPERRSFYEAQPQIERQLREFNEGQEQRRYITRLRRDASFTDLDGMVEKLTQIAEARYYRP